MEQLEKPKLGAIKSTQLLSILIVREFLFGRLDNLLRQESS